MRALMVGKVMKQSLVYGYAVTQPFAFYIDSQPMLQDQLLAEAHNLQYGEQSEIIRHVQLKLNKTGYYTDKIDGVYGLFTEQAVRGFQSSESLTVNGQIDQETLKAIMIVEKKQEIKKIKPFLDSINYGEKSEAVSVVQEVLYYYGYYTGYVDGIYGPLTEAAIDKVTNEGLLEEKRNTYSSKQQTNIVSTLHPNKTTPKTNKSTEKTPDVIQVEVSNNNSTIIETAKTYLGTPYVWGGKSPSGFDCSGFIQFVYEQENTIIPRTVNEIWNFSTSVPSPSIGDLVFFETYQPGPSHLGIYLGQGNFIHAGSSRGVEISNLNDNSYWKARYLGAKRISD